MPWLALITTSFVYAADHSIQQGGISIRNLVQAYWNIISSFALCVKTEKLSKASVFR